MTDTLAVVEAPPPLALFGTTDPIQVIAEASRVAAALADVVNKQKLYAVVNQKKFPTVEAWTLCGSMLGVFPITEWVHELRNEDGTVRGFEARVRAQTLGGRIVGAGEARCVKGESATWSARSQEYALSSMAQTRATSKALRGPLDFIFKLAGFQPTPAEEMDGRATGEIPTGEASAASQEALREAENGGSQSPSAKLNRQAAAAGTAPPVPFGGEPATVTEPASAPAPVERQNRSTGPRAKRRNVVAAPQGAPSERSGTTGVKVPTTTPTVSAMTLTPPDDGQAEYLETLRASAGEVAAKLHHLNIKRKNRKAALNGQPQIAEPSALPNSDSERSLRQYIANAQGELGLNAATLEELDEKSLAAVINALEIYVSQLAKGE